MFQLNKEVNHALQDDKALKMERLLKTLGEEFAHKHIQASSKGKPFKGPHIIWIIFAVISLSVIFLAWKFGSPNPSPPLNPAQLYAMYYETYPTTNAIRSIGNKANIPLKRALQQYESMDYQNAVITFNQILGKDNLNQEEQALAHFYKGLALLGSGEITMAQHQLETVLQFSSHTHMQQTQWYLALIAIKNNELDIARKYLNETLLTSPKGKYANKAKELLEVLKNKL